MVKKVKTSSYTAPSKRASTRSKALGPRIRVGGFVGYRTPGAVRTRTGSRAFYEKVYSKDAAEGMATVLANFQKVVDNIKEATPDALYFGLLPTFQLSQEFVPYDTGALSESGKLEVDDQSREPRVFIKYGDAAAGVNYAAIVHEITYFHHAPPTRSKYLQAAFEKTLGGIKERVIAALRPAASL